MSVEINITAILSLSQPGLSCFRTQGLFTGTEMPTPSRKETCLKATSIFTIVRSKMNKALRIPYQKKKKKGRESYSRPIKDSCCPGHTIFTKDRVLPRRNVQYKVLYFLLHQELQITRMKDISEDYKLSILCI